MYLKKLLIVEFIDLVGFKISLGSFGAACPKISCNSNAGGRRAKLSKNWKLFKEMVLQNQTCNRQCYLEAKTRNGKTLKFLGRVMVVTNHAIAK